jgi:hypothetical protein
MFRYECTVEVGQYPKVQCMSQQRTGMMFIVANIADNNNDDKFSHG